MKSDPADNLKSVMVTRPPRQGPGSGKDAWISYATEMSESNEILWRYVDEQSEAIRDLRAEIEMLRNHIASRKPKGGRPRTDDRKIEMIERDLAAGLSHRQAAARNGVSAMTVTRIARQAEARRRQITGNLPEIG